MALTTTTSPVTPDYERDKDFRSNQLRRELIRTRQHPISKGYGTVAVHHMLDWLDDIYTTFEELMTAWNEFLRDGCDEEDARALSRTSELLHDALINLGAANMAAQKVMDAIGHEFYIARDTK